MNVLGLLHSGFARFEEKIYGIQVGLSVYVGLVRASVQEKIPLLNNHVWAAIGLSIIVVLAIQLIIVLLALFSKTVGTILDTPRLISRITKESIRVVQPLRSIR